MKSKFTKLRKILPKTVSAVLVFWLSSILVLVCCSPHLLVASEKEMDESCPMQKGHECCKKNIDSKTLSKKEKENPDCCVFKPTKTLSGDLKTVKLSKHTLIAAEKVEIAKTVYFINTSYQPSKVYHPAIRNRGSTYLQNCVFRI